MCKYFSFILISRNLKSCYLIADDLINQNVLNSQLISSSSSSYCTLLKHLFDIPVITAIFICNNVYKQFFTILTNYSYYCSEACKSIYSICASSLRNSQSLTSCLNNLQSDTLYIGSDNDIAILREKKASFGKQIHSISMTELTEVDEIDIDPTSTIIILPESFINYVITHSFIQQLIYTQSKNALIQLIFYVCRNNLLAIKRLLNSMKRLLVEDTAYVQSNVQLMFTLIDFLSQKDLVRKKELISYVVCDPDSIWKIALSNGSSLVDVGSWFE